MKKLNCDKGICCIADDDHSTGEKGITGITA